MNGRQNSESIWRRDIRVKLPTGILEVSVQPGVFELDDLCKFAARNNPRRGYLFVSTVLGKHWPAQPSKMRELHEHLAEQITIEHGTPVVFVAMAETAVGLGQGVFESFLDQHPDSQVLFLHTTRYPVPGLEIVTFEESHSHAPDQLLHLPPDSELRDLFLRAKTLVMVDDEMSTGNTFVNLVLALKKHHPGFTRIELVTITDFSGDDGHLRIASKLPAPASFISALNGTHKFTSDPEFSAKESCGPVMNSISEFNSSPGWNGRAGRVSAIRLPSTLIDCLLEGCNSGDEVLVLGFGEFMHAAFRIGLALEKKGLKPVVQSTTRSPILAGQCINHTIQLDSDFSDGVPYFLYNVEPGQYSKVLICHEAPLGLGVAALAKRLSATCIYFKSEDQIEILPIS